MANDISIVAPRIKRGVSKVDNKPDPPYGSKKSNQVREQRKVKAKNRRK